MYYQQDQHNICLLNYVDVKDLSLPIDQEYPLMRYLRVFIVFVFSFTLQNASASHIRAGEIIATRVSGLTYKFTFIGYRDVGGVEFGNGIFDFGDGNTFGGDNQNQIIPWITPIDLGNGVEKWQFSLTHTFNGPSGYLVSYNEENRNGDIQNIAGSINIPFYVETLIIIDPLFSNNSPYFTVPPIDQGVVGAIFEHNPGAVDPDGDSLSYYFVIPKSAKGIDVGSYQSLIDPGFYENFSIGNQASDGPPTLGINVVDGTLVWDAPGGVGIPPLENREFNVAFVVEEWRRINGVLFRLGFVTRDMQIIIWNYDNDPPEIEVPEDTCIVAGTSLQSIITATDPNGDQVKLEAFGSPFEAINSPATYSPTPATFQELPATLTFDWETICGQVRATPYDVQFKATDKPTIEGVPSPPGQSSFETWRITILGPPPTGLVAETQPGRQIQLSWDDYSCQNADSIQVWRRVGEFEFDPSCSPGIPTNAGYELVETLGITNNSFLDSNNTMGLAPGSKYCYRLVATFPSPLGGLSISSEEACDSLLVDVPVITNVDVTSTGESDGTIRVNWTPPYEIDAIAFPPTYSYEVMRKEAVAEDGTFISISGLIADTTFLDQGLNTKEVRYEYQVILYDNGGDQIDQSQSATSIRLEPQPLIGGIRVNWQADVPWSLTVQEFPYHYIYRDNVVEGNLSSLQLIDSVDVTLEGLTYLDDGRFNGVDLDEEIEYCYYVETQGSYGNALLPQPLINKSQIICAQPNDTIPPCAPVSITFSTALTCETQVSCDPSVTLSNSFSWQFDGDQSCDNDIVSFRIYSDRSETGIGRSDEFRRIGETSQLEYLDGGLKSLAYCYYITAVDRSGNESQISEIVCNDNCAQFKLPNVFTPNGDFLNETFTAFADAENCPRFVESVKFKVFNRSGVEIYTYESGTEKPISIDWDGKANNGKELPSGVYFYSAEVKFILLNPEESLQVINGWVHIMR